MTTENEIQEAAPELEVNPVTNTVLIPEMPVDVSDAALQTPTTVASPEPSPEPTVEPSPEPISAVTDAERAELMQLRANQAEVLRLQAINDQNSQAQQVTAQIYQELLQEGFDDQAAQRMTGRMTQERMAGNARVQQVEDLNLARANHARGKQNAAAHYGKLHGVDPGSLMSFDTPQAMEQHAVLLKDNGANAKRLAVLEGKTVDDGSPDGGLPSGSVPLSGTKLATAAADPDYYDKMTAKQKEDLGKFLGI